MLVFYFLDWSKSDRWLKNKRKSSPNKDERERERERKIKTKISVGGDEFRKTVMRKRESRRLGRAAKSGLS